MPSGIKCRRFGRRTLKVSPSAYSERAATTCLPPKPKATDWAKKIKPTPDTLNVIRKIEKGEGNDTIHRLTGKSVRNISKIRSQFHNGLYEL